MARKPQKLRTEEQRLRQKALREKAKAERRPSRDDVARALLYQVIVGVLQQREDQKAVLEKLADQVVAMLESQGFDSQQSYDVFSELVRKYSKSTADIPAFRPKRHLKN